MIMRRLNDWCRHRKGWLPPLQSYPSKTMQECSTLNSRTQKVLPVSDCHLTLPAIFIQRPVTATKTCKSITGVNNTRLKWSSIQTPDFTPFQLTGKNRQDCSLLLLTA